MDKMNKITQAVDHAVMLVNRVFVFLAGFLLVSLMLVICGNVLIRFFFDTSWAWSIEVSEYMMLYVTFLVAPWVLRNNDHIAFDLFHSNASPRTQRRLNIVSYILGLLVCVVLTVFGFEVTWDHYVRDVILYNTLLMPKFILLLIIPVSGALMFLEFLKKLLHELQPIQTSTIIEDNG